MLNLIVVECDFFLSVVEEKDVFCLRHPGRLVGWLKFRMARIGTYVGLANFMMLLYTTARSKPGGLDFWMVLILGVSCMVVLSFVDYKVVIHNEVRANYRENPWMVELSEDVKRCRVLLENKDGE